MKKNSSILILLLYLIASSCSMDKSDKSAQKPKNIILLIGDGMGTAQIYGGLTVNHGTLNLERCTHVGFSKTQSSDAYITDSAAGATAFSIGRKTYNGAIGVDSLGAPHETILETAEKNGMASGLVATCSITHATPGSFIAHQLQRSMDQEIAADFLKTDIDVFIGGGRKHFENRKDGRNLLTELKAKGYEVADSTDDWKKFTTGKLAALVASDYLPKMSEGRGDYLKVATETALQLLSSKPKGFFLMVEGSQIDWGAHGNDTGYATSEMIDFDQAIGAALDFAKRDGNTLVIVTADHETGGMALTAGDMKSGTVEAKFVTNGHTGVMVPVFAFGPGAEAFSGIYPNTEIYKKMIGALGLLR
jgi:alkaline phosphatase